MKRVAETQIENYTHERKYQKVNTPVRKKNVHTRTKISVTYHEIMTPLQKKNIVMVYFNLL